jgi:hypothetical protein
MPPGKRLYWGHFFDHEKGFANCPKQRVAYDHHRCNCQRYVYKGVKGEISIEENFSIPPDDENDFDESP